MSQEIIERWPYKWIGLDLLQCWGNLNAQVNQYITIDRYSDNITNCTIFKTYYSHVEYV